MRKTFENKNVEFNHTINLCDFWGFGSEMFLKCVRHSIPGYFHNDQIG
jgi:hypothetical protein